MEIHPLPDTTLAYSNLNLRFNPFGELGQRDRQSLACVDITTLRDFLNACASSKIALQFVADHGRGKTTHLLALHKHFQEIPYTKATSGKHRRLRTGDRHFIDSFEEINLWHRLCVYRRCRWLAVTTHRSLFWELCLSGFTVKTVYVSVTCHHQLQHILQKRIEFARRSDGPVPVITLDRIALLQRQHGDNIRGMESELYDEFLQIQKDTAWKKTHLRSD